MPSLRRRAFLSSLAATAAAPAILRAQGSPKRLPIAFSTLGCPLWSWKAILEAADRLGYSGIELRGVAGEMDLPKVPELQGARLAETKQDLKALGLVVTDLGASSRMHEKDKAARDKQLDEGRRFIDLAQAMGVPYVRMFGDKLPPEEPKDEVMKRVVDGFQQMAAHAKAAGVTVLIESHGDFTRSGDLGAILKGVGSDAFQLLWDAHHTFVAGKEAPAETWKSLGPHVRHTHLKDSKPEGTERRYVLTGGGEVPVKEQVRVLVQGGYKGFYCFEWEKKWHPEIEEPEVAFPHYAKTMRDYLSEAGFKSA
ncbi:MAG TPA: sugar phosphate isomerase/epimerase family protein [Vicinamibacteria bacterium]|jgi:sugar phosphate isomerase/epimerase